MAKNITVTNIDNINIADKSNMGSDQPRKKVKMLHEQLYEQYGIDPNKIFERTGLLKTIPPEWIPEILILNINTCKIPKTYQNVNLNDKVITMGFENSEICEKFYQEFNININKAINTFLTSKKEDPKRYNRIIVVETTVDNQQITFRY